MSEERRLVEREVRAEDPQLSPEANRLLTDELREAVGTDRAKVPAERADSVGRVGGAGHTTVASVVAGNRLLVAITFLALLIVGVIVALTTDDWWAVVVAAAAHAIGTLLVATMAIRMSTQVEHVAPATAARLEEEGVADPDRALSELVEQYSPDQSAGGAAEAVSSGNNSVSVEPADDALRAGVEQRTAITPAGSPVRPAGLRGAPTLLPIAAVVGSVVIGVLVAVLQGGIAWVGAALLVASSLAWLFLQLRMAGSAEQDGDTRRPDRPTGDSRRAQRTLLLPTIAIVTAAVAAGVVIVGAIGGYL